MYESEEWMFRARIMLYSQYSGYSGYILSIQRVYRVYIYTHIVRNILPILWILSDRGSYVFYSDDCVCVCVCVLKPHYKSWSSWTSFFSPGLKTYIFRKSELELVYHSSSLFMNNMYLIK